MNFAVFVNIIVTVVIQKLLHIQYRDIASVWLGLNVSLLSCTQHTSVHTSLYSYVCGVHKYLQLAAYFEAIFWEQAKMCFHRW